MEAEAVMLGRGMEFPLPFFPARLTPLAFTPAWRLLGDQHQLRYSQLYALYHNEQTVFFEEILATNVLPAFYQRPDLIGEELAADLRRFEEEETRHSIWFRELNHFVDSARFRMEEGSYVFVPAGARTRAVTGWFARRPFAFPWWIWLMLLQEERSVAVSRECLKNAPDLEPAFIALHRKHMADEIDHVQWDVKLVERVWLPMPRWKRLLHARMFGWMMAEFFTVPKRSARAVLRALIDEFPELVPLENQLFRELADLASSVPYHASLYSRETTPRCFALFDELPEFRDIGRALLAYQRP